MIVVDSSAVIELLLNADRSPYLRERFLTPPETLHAPHLIDLEVLQVIRRFRLTAKIDDVRAEQALADHLALPIERYPHDMLFLRAWDLRANFTAYDAIYIAIAGALRATLVTFDLRLAKAAERFISVEVP